MRRTILLTSILVVGTTVAVFRLVRAQSPPVLPTITFYASYPFHNLKHPTGISASIQTGTLYLFIADSDNNVVRLFNLLPNGTTSFSTFAGTGAAGYVNGVLTSAQFHRPTGLKGGRRTATICPAGCTGCALACRRTYWWTEIYLNDSANYATRLLCANSAAGPAGYPCSFKDGVSTLIGSPTPPARGHVDGNVSVARVAEMADIGFDPSGHLYLADAGNQAIRAFDFTNVSTYAGTGQTGYVNGFRTNALFNTPTSIALDTLHSNSLYVTDTDNHVIRKIDAAGNVTTLAGTGQPGYVDGIGSQAEFYRPTNIVFNPSNGYSYIADASNNVIRRVDANGNVSTYAGAKTPGLVNGSLSQARFNSPTALAIFGNFMYVSDSLNNCIRRIDMVNGVVSTYIN